ncbi:flagellar basal body rod protein FlgB [Clostridium botulinum]|uniref:Flagellar basal body rod protein FlgB n=1 Tax=Clostridium botulinum C/D str. DC5 TaxID=1443128 RepID=A0A0A0IMJ8_CLOBO|nr:flagellar basal body rod protein FlgB [Clostridium botulinum]KEI02071.1 flagellar basal body rod protein FlgB [Clostridium botulinum C/D str. BKT75002]KEI09505.1 flagellar basal body rod protein FlgB [Clostridium botulinum C/D str. BKT2873]KGN01849.1 flagellar basal body rod protein FlgB [Clostridium botulinum C/D str. DC5]KOC55703.1 flagellar biosynthesis protein FlgB [Clostridium botulinum]KOC57610.1 flagellar biosynthesis protein FlgB [Clostridium botulinum]
MKIGNVSESQKNYDLIKQSLNATAKRKNVINNNISNFNTKGYKRSYVTFEDSLKESKDKLDLKITNDKHIAYKKKFGEISVKKDESDSMKMDGNNVDVDNEMTNLAANNLEYNALITTLNSTLSLKRYIINGGR